MVKSVNQYMFYQSPTYRQVDLEKMKEIVSKFMGGDKTAKYEIIVGTDSQKIENNKYDFVSALIIHRVGELLPNKPIVL